MTGYVTRRVLQSLGVLLGVSVIVFGLLHLTGDPTRLLLPLEAREEGGSVIVPGDSSRSPLYQRIVSSDPEEVMPPPKSNLKLTSSQIDLLKRWIEAGAPE